MVLLVLDTSVVIKWFREETYSENAIFIRQRLYEEKDAGLVPDLLIYELSNALRYKEDYTQQEVKDAITNFLDMEISVATPSSDVIHAAIQLSYRYDISVYDAIFVALSGRAGAIMLTADKRLYDKIKELGYVKFITEFGKQ